MHSILTVVPVTAPPSADLTTLQAVKDELGIADTSQDTALSGQITLWSKVIAEICRRTFGQQRVIETFRIAHHHREKIRAIPLSQIPVVGDIAVTVDDVDEDAANFELDASSGVLWHLHRPWHGKVVVTYTGGYDLPDEAPSSLARACIELVKEQRYAAGRDPSIRGVQHGDTRVDYWVGPRGDANDAVPSYILDLIAPFKFIAI